MFSTNIAGKQSKIRMNNALRVPDLRTNLLSVGKITENNYDVIFKKNGTCSRSQRKNKDDS